MAGRSNSRNLRTRNGTRLAVDLVDRAIQIAGTDSDAQLPFFITSCDYTLIGEELYAASVYLGREPMLLGSLKAQDMAKLIIIMYVLVGVAAAVFGVNLDFWSGTGAAGAGG